MAPAEAASSSWPSFAEMASSVMPNDGGDGGGGGGLREAEDAESYVGDEDIMDYQWNEDNIDIDFITGNERKELMEGTLKVHCNGARARRSRRRGRRRQLLCSWHAINPCRCLERAAYFEARRLGDASVHREWSTRSFYDFL